MRVCVCVYLKNNDRSHKDNKFIYFLLKSIDINQCSKKLARLLQFKQKTGLK